MDVTQRGLMIDMDGVIYTGEQLVDGADKFVATLQKANIPFIFLSNNSERTRSESVDKLRKLGIVIPESQVYTSAMATGSFLKDQYPNCSAFVLGGEGLLKSLKANGVHLVDKDPDFVVLGEGHNFTLPMVRQAADMILDGARFLATNRDPSPRKKGWNNLGIAGTAAMLTEATGREPFVIGKPSPVMLHSACSYMKLPPSSVSIVGDTMETDIIGALYMGMNSILVLSGLAEKNSYDAYAFKPSLVVETVSDIKFPLAWWPTD